MGAFSLAIGCVRPAAFGGSAAGEVRLRNVEGSKRGDEDWEMSFYFARLPQKRRRPRILLSGAVSSKKAYAVACLSAPSPSGAMTGG